MASLVWNWLMANAVPIGYLCVALIGACTGWILHMIYPKD